MESQAKVSHRQQPAPTITTYGGISRSPLDFRLPVRVYVNKNMMFYRLNIRFEQKGVILRGPDIAEK